MIGISRILPRAQSAARRLVFTEAAAVTPEGRISPQDLGVWSEKHFEPLERIARFMENQGARAGIQLAHAGRKGKHLSAWGGTRRRFGKRRRVASGRPERHCVQRHLCQARRADDRPDQVLAEGVRAGGRTRGCRGFRRDRNSRRARLSDPRIPVAVQQSSRRRLRRLVRKSNAISSGMRRSGETYAARAQPAVRTSLGDRLG